MNICAGQECKRSEGQAQWGDPDMGSGSEIKGSFPWIGTEIKKSFPWNGTEIKGGFPYNGTEIKGSLKV